MLCYCCGSVSDHFGPSAFNKFGFEFGFGNILANMSHRSFHKHLNPLHYVSGTKSAQCGGMCGSIRPTLFLLE